MKKIARGGDMGVEQCIQRGCTMQKINLDILVEFFYIYNWKSLSSNFTPALNSVFVTYFWFDR